MGKTGNSNIRETKTMKTEFVFYLEDFEDGYSINLNFPFKMSKGDSIHAENYLCENPIFEKNSYEITCNSWEVTFVIFGYKDGEHNQTVGISKSK